MRKITILLLALGIALAAAPAAFAQDNETDDADAEAADGGHGKPAKENRTANATERHEAAKARHAELKAARQVVLDAFHANRTAILAEYHESLNATRASFLENKTRVLEACNETRAAFTNNSEGEGSPEHAKCVKDGLKPLIETARAQNAAARELAKQKLADERQNGMAAWNKARHEANEHYKARAGEDAATDGA